MQKGTWVRIADGPFADRFGEIVEISPKKGKAKVRISATLTVEVGIGSLEQIEKPAEIEEPTNTQLIHRATRDVEIGSTDTEEDDELAETGEEPGTQPIRPPTDRDPDRQLKKRGKGGKGDQNLKEKPDWQLASGGPGDDRGKPPVGNGEKINKEGTVAKRTQPEQGRGSTAPAREARDLESCPVCGRLKDKQREVTKTVNGKPVKEVQPILTCGTCSKAFGEYQDQATKAIVANPAEAPEPMTKIEWVLEQINLAKFQRDAEEAVASYRQQYADTVIAPLEQRHYLDGDPEWGEEPYLRRPRMRFTQATFKTAIAVKDQLEEKLNDPYRTMRQMMGRLEVATRVVPELQAKTGGRPPAETEQ